QPGEVQPLHQSARARYVGRCAQEPALGCGWCRGPAEPGLGQRGRGAVADDDLPGPGDLFHLGQRAGGRTGEDEVAMVVVPEQEEVAWSAVDADRHAEADRAPARLPAPGG